MIIGYVYGMYTCNLCLIHDNVRKTSFYNTYVYTCKVNVNHI